MPVANNAFQSARRAFAALSLILAAACGGGGGDNPAPGSAAPIAAGMAPASHANAMSLAELGAGANLNGVVPFPADNAWNTDISGVPVDPDSDILIASIGTALSLHPDFGAATYGGARIGIPYVVVGAGQPRVAVNLGVGAAESDPGPYPIPADAPVEGQSTRGGAGTGDRHLIVVDRDNARLYELFNARINPDRSWNADAAAVFRLDSNSVRPGARAGWASADAAGLPIFPGLVRYDEASTGRIRHALRFTVSRTRRAYVPPANHATSLSPDTILPPMGMRVRLKSSFVIPTTFSTEVQAILKALKTYGMIVADNGTGWYISGAPDARWDDETLVSQLANVIGADFEVVRMDGLTVVP